MAVEKIIPEKYWNRLYDWEGGGYDGCIWEMNQGAVDGEGHWRPIYSTGCDGLDLGAWYKRRLGYLKSDLGYDATDVDIQHHQDLMRTVKRVFGEEWYMVEGHSFEDPRVVEFMKESDARYGEFKKRRDALIEERTRLLDTMFMEVVNGELKRERFEEIGSLDEEHVKETCRRFCDGYGGNVGMIATVLDWLAGNGYEAWCTCSDCGKQFRLGNYDSFAHSMDGNSYTGNGGVGVIMDRILCDECHEAAECRVCHELNKPNPGEPDKGAARLDEYGFLARLFLDWLDVCHACTDGYKYRKLIVWDEAKGARVRSEVGEKYMELEDGLEEKYGKDGRDLYETMKADPSGDGRREINEIRDLLEGSVKEHFANCLCGDEFSDRLEQEAGK